MRGRLAVVFACLAVVVLAKDSSQWLTGTLISVEPHTYTSSTRNHPNIELRDWTYTIDAGERVYEAEGGPDRPIRVEVNGPVTFSIEKDHLYIKDAEGHRFKLDLLKTTRKK